MPYFDASSTLDTEPKRSITDRRRVHNVNIFLPIHVTRNPPLASSKPSKAGLILGNLLPRLHLHAKSAGKNGIDGRKRNILRLTALGLLANESRIVT
jgi:hypothetical protein